MTSETLRLTSEQLWMSALFMVFLDAVIIGLLVWRLSPFLFRELRWTIVMTAALAWGIYGMALLLIFWNAYYQFLYPAWFRSGGLLLFIPLVFGLKAWAFHWLAVHMPGNPVLAFSLLGGLDGLAEHLAGIYGLKILAVPLLQQASPASILGFAVPEYIFYWLIVLTFAALFHHGLRRGMELRRSAARLA